MHAEIPNYTLLHKLGEGAMAEVWLAEHKRNGRKAAIKILKSSATADGDFEKLFLREGQVLAGFDHPNIVKIYDNDRIGDIAYLVMENLTGGTLLERMQRGPITIGEALGLVAQIAAGLEAAHKLGVVHRDLKPANIMLRDETTPVLTDFGAVRLLDRSTIYGRDGLIVGTPIYMSPEQVSGEALSGSSDLYALGVIFYELLTGSRPFPGLSFPEIAAQHLYAPIPQLPDALAMLQPVLQRLLAKKAEDRYPHAQAFVDELRAVFIHDEALRQQVGYSGTSMAWSSQLRALGFVLDGAQKLEVRRAQGEFLLGQATSVSAGAHPSTKPTAATLKAPAQVPPAPATAPSAPAPAVSSSRRPALVGLTLAVAAIVGGLAWWWQRDSGPMAVPIAVEPAAPVAVPPAAADEATALAEAQAAVAALQLRNRYLAQLDATVRDNKTDLSWTETDNGADIDWTDAGQYCAALGAGWELPSMAELEDLFDATGSLRQSCGDSQCAVTPLLRLSGKYFWSRREADDLRAWVVDLSRGTRQMFAAVNPFGLRVLCVRHS